MAKILKHDTDGTKSLLEKGEFGFDDYPAGGDAGRVWVGNGAVNIALAKKDELDAVVQTPISISAVVAGSYSLSNTLKTLAFDAITYTGNGTSQEIVTGLSTIDFTQVFNGTGYYHDRVAGDCIVKNDAGTIVESGSIDFKDIDGVDGLCQVHIKGRSVDYGNHFIDGLRGVNKTIYSNLTNVEENSVDKLNSFSNIGFNLGASASTNQNLATYIAYQTLYTHIKWGLTSQGKRYIEAYNPVTNEGMIMYQGSGVAGHQIPHSVGVDLDYIEARRLDNTHNWATYNSISGATKYQQLNTANGDTDLNTIWNDTNPNDSYITIGSEPLINNNGGSFVLYYKCKSETFTIGTYTGTGVAGNFVETKDSDGIARRPARIIIKAVSGVGAWNLYDYKRLTVGGGGTLSLDASDAEDLLDNVLFIEQNGFIVTDLTNNRNVAGVQYLYLVEFDTDSTGSSGAYFDNPTNNTYARLDNGVISYANGYDNASVNSRETFTGNLIPNNGWED